MNEKKEKPHLASAKCQFTPIVHKKTVPDSPVQILRINDLQTPKVVRSHSSSRSSYQDDDSSKFFQFNDLNLDMIHDKLSSLLFEIEKIQSHRPKYVNAETQTRETSFQSKGNIYSDHQSNHHSSSDKKKISNKKEMISNKQNGQKIRKVSSKQQISPEMPNYQQVIHEASQFLENTKTELKLLEDI